ncbi:hypothetical protein [Mahella australiensis]|uniref:Uncharacterized protein n=1 Tax=Mahella australiensis (strain DSM 15567 / CIP 107919 / 50-1 BON) TaxID=697281 RepID=F3ZXG2_MAHA5|nr:hypothetical protein [Mahella australiensis]AEE97643.1 hypothetical protein Mahau_2485 [Mahella australiensis 50-1 BON]
MHSLIVQLGETPISENEFISEYDFEEGSFVGSVADYVSDEVDRQEYIRWFIDSLPSDYIKYDGQSIIFLPGFKVFYFKPRFEKLKKIVEELTLENFITGLSTYEISKLINHKYGFYVYEEYWRTFDDFVRELIEGVPYYIGGILDYHF